MVSLKSQMKIYSIYNLRFRAKYLKKTKNMELLFEWKHLFGLILLLLLIGITINFIKRKIKKLKQ